MNGRRSGTGVIRQLHDRLVRKEVSAGELLDDSLETIREKDKEIHAFLHVDAEGARAAALAVDRRIARGEEIPLLAGIPCAVKDVICTAGMPTTAGSRILEGFVPPYDATVIERLRAAGAVIVGKTNLDEFAMGSSTEFSAYGPTRNPLDPTRVPGGSSGGSAAAVAADMVPYSLGTDTGGSIRQPAAFCGLVGMKPTYGRVSRYGVIAYASSFDQVGPFATSVADAAAVLAAIAGPDPRDSTTLPEPVPAWTSPDHDRQPTPGVRGGTPGVVRGVRVGVPREFFPAGMDPVVERAVRAAIDELADGGAQVEEVSVPSAPAALAMYYILVTAEASTNLARYDGVRFGRRVPAATLEEAYRRTRGRGFGADVKRRILLGTFVLSAGYAEKYYRQAVAARHALAADFARAFERVDVLVTPATPERPFRLGEKTDDPLCMYASDLLTVPVNVAGLPALVVPWKHRAMEEREKARAEDFGVGLQFIAPARGEDILFRFARAVA